MGSVCLPLSDSFLFIFGCVSIYIHKCVCVIFFSQAGQSIRTTFFLMGLSDHLCDEAEPEGLGLSHVVTLGRLAVTCF